LLQECKNVRVLHFSMRIDALNALVDPMAIERFNLLMVAEFMENF